MREEGGRAGCQGTEVLHRLEPRLVDVPGLLGRIWDISLLSQSGISDRACLRGATRVTPRVLAGMEFRPAISSDLKVMEGGVFEPRRLGLRERWDARAAAAGPGPR